MQHLRSLHRAAGNRCWINRDYAITRLKNAGEFGDVWGPLSFGSAGTYCRHLTRFLDWFYETQSCEAHPDCPR